MVKLFRRRGKETGKQKFRCYICGLEKDLTWDKIVKHVKKHIKKGEIDDEQEVIVGECIRWNENI
ncbi:MAG: hypothetical protein N2V75_00450 [Methanophagales archaeon]|nr:hypothetical protein [Methanophagales archaeon]